MEVLYVSLMTTTSPYFQIFSMVGENGNNSHSDQWFSGLPPA